jgi:hypothetical protein
MFYIIGVLVIVTAIANFIAYKLGLAKTNWLHVFETWWPYLFTVAWASIILTLVIHFGHLAPSFPIAAGIAVASGILGYVTERVYIHMWRREWQRRNARSG